MKEEKQYIAVDLGAESGRVILGTVSGERVVLEEVHRFGNVPIEKEGVLRLDFEGLLCEVKAGISKAAKAANNEISGIGVDSWGAGIGLIDEQGELIENPYHYRSSTVEMMEKAYEFMPKRRIYENTGLQFMQFNDIYRLLEMRVTNYEPLARAKNILFMADLFSYHLCGEVFSEYTLAGCSQLVDMSSGEWSQEIFDSLSLPLEKMAQIVQPGTVVGRLTESVAEELGCERIPFIAVGSHDTASAVASAPATGGYNWAYLSCGTWSLIGVEVPGAIINDKTFEYDFTNEGGVDNTIRLLKNVMGLWLVQECRRHWQSRGPELSYGELTEMAQKAPAFTAYVDPDCNEFFAPGDMPARINKYLTETQQGTIEDKGRMVRVALESLAFKYRLVLERIEDVISNRIDVLHIVGGGIQNELLCQFAANATGKKVIAGPVEATASGNILMQAMATGQIKTLAQLRQIVANSFEMKEYQPRDSELWQKHYTDFRYTR
ncbi:MAG: rhamnulokinase [Planctomycetota bacterium]